MPGANDALRQRLLASITSLSADKLPLVEAFLAGLECGDLSPLWFSSFPGVHVANERAKSSRQRKRGDLSSLSLNSAASAFSNQSGDESPRSIIPIDWPHAPLHRIGECGVYMVTAGTLQ